MKRTPRRKLGVVIETRQRSANDGHTSGVNAIGVARRTSEDGTRLAEPWILTAGRDTRMLAWQRVSDVPSCDVDGPATANVIVGPHQYLPRHEFSHHADWISDLAILHNRPDTIVVSSFDHSVSLCDLPELPLLEADHLHVGRNHTGSAAGPAAGSTDTIGGEAARGHHGRTHHHRAPRTTGLPRHQPLRPPTILVDTFRSEVSSVAVLPNDRGVISGCLDGTLCLHDLGENPLKIVCSWNPVPLGSGSTVGTLLASQASGLTKQSSIAVSSSMTANGGGGGAFSAGEAILCVARHLPAPSRTAAVPAGESSSSWGPNLALVGTSRGTIAGMDLRQSKATTAAVKQRHAHGEGSAVRNIRHLPPEVGGFAFVSAGCDGRVSVWDLRHMSLVPMKSFHVHDDAVWALAGIPDVPQLMWSAGRDGRIMLTNVVDNRSAEFAQLDFPVTCLAFDGCWPVGGHHQDAMGSLLVCGTTGETAVAFEAVDAFLSSQFGCAPTPTAAPTGVALPNEAVPESNVVDRPQSGKDAGTSHEGHAEPSPPRTDAPATSAAAMFSGAVPPSTPKPESRATGRRTSVGAVTAILMEPSPPTANREATVSTTPLLRQGGAPHHLLSPSLLSPAVLDATGNAKGASRPPTVGVDGRDATTPRRRLTRAQVLVESTTTTGDFEFVPHHRVRRLSGDCESGCGSSDDSVTSGERDGDEEDDDGEEPFVAPPGRPLPRITSSSPWWCSAWAVGRRNVFVNPVAEQWCSAVRYLNGQPGVVKAMLSTTRLHAVALSSDGSVSLWDLLRQTCVHVFEPGTSLVNAQKWSALGTARTSFSLPRWTWCHVDARWGGVVVTLSAEESFGCVLTAWEYLWATESHQVTARRQVGSWLSRANHDHRFSDRDVVDFQRPATTWEAATFPAQASTLSTARYSRSRRKHLTSSASINVGERFLRSIFGASPASKTDPAVAAPEDGNHVTSVVVWSPQSSKAGGVVGLSVWKLPAALRDGVTQYHERDVVQFVPSWVLAWVLQPSGTVPAGFSKTPASHLSTTPVTIVFRPWQQPPPAQPPPACSSGATPFAPPSVAARDMLSLRALTSAELAALPQGSLSIARGAAIHDVIAVIAAQLRLAPADLPTLRSVQSLLAEVAEPVVVLVPTAAVSSHKDHTSQLSSSSWLVDLLERCLEEVMNVCVGSALPQDMSTALSPLSNLAATSRMTLDEFVVLEAVLDARPSLPAYDASASTTTTTSPSLITPSPCTPSSMLLDPLMPVATALSLYGSNVNKGTLIVTYRTIVDCVDLR